MARTAETRFDALRRELQSIAAELRAACAARHHAGIADLLERAARLALSWPSSDGLSEQRIEAVLANGRAWLGAADLAAVADVADLLVALSEADGGNDAA